MSERTESNIDDIIIDEAQIQGISVKNDVTKITISFNFRAITPELTGELGRLAKPGILNRVTISPLPQEIDYQDPQQTDLLDDEEVEDTDSIEQEEEEF